MPHAVMSFSSYLPQRSISSFLVRVWSALRSPFHNCHESAIVHQSLLGPTSQLFLLVSLGDFRSLILDFAGTCQTSMNLSHCGCRIISKFEELLWAKIRLEPKW